VAQVVILYLAVRDLFATRLSTALLVIAIAVGVGFQIPNTANLAGSTATIVDEGLVWGFGDVRIEPADRARFADGDATAHRITDLVGGRAVPMIRIAGAIGNAANGTRGTLVAVPVFGVDFSPSPVRISAGAPLARGDRDGVIVGSTIAQRIGATVGSTVELRVIVSAPEAAITDDSIAAFTLTVRGIASGSGAYRFAYLDRTFLAEVLGEPRAASVILLHLEDHADAAAIAAALAVAIPSLHAVDWSNDDPQMPRLIGANRAIDRVSYGMVMAAISVPLLALFYIRVLRRRRSLAIMQALGFSRRELLGIQLVQSLIVAAVGSALGATIGYAAIAYFRRSPVFEWGGMTVTPLASTATFLVPIAVAAAAALVAGAIAAWRTLRTEPARVLQRLE
jgi:ABC-type lipoprotein release transport system permease subunit